MSDYGGDDGDDGYEPYEPAEPTFDEDEPGFEPQDPDDVENPDGTARNPHAGAGHDDPDALGNGNVNGNAHTIVSVGEGEGTRSAGKKNAVVGLREKKIPESKRSTTPYMTKYERARVLGTRALQIR
ncbi:DNA-directed RNA polymerases I II and III subunit RPABC2 [Lobaria immixta]|nr:DNA-directed RNA polymerases I II and III subunit RPABC2 [Lobaria immixta]